MQTSVVPFQSPGDAKPVVHILHDSPEWVIPLETALAGRGVPHRSWLMNEGLVPQDGPPPIGVFYNRIGASAHLRGNPHAPAFSGLVLDWLARHGRWVVNARRALELELSKLAQQNALDAAGIATPRTIPAVGDAFVLEAVRAHAGRPVILKHNRGGKGHGVVRLESVAEAEAHLRDPHCARPVDGVWLVQEQIVSPEPCVYRCEFVGGRFLYAMRVDTAGGFALCPAEVCSLSANGPTYALSNALDGDPIVPRLARFLARNQIEIASVELIRDAAGQWFAFDVNTNTNYNAAAEQAAGLNPGGMLAVADYLRETLAMTRGLAA